MTKSPFTFISEKIISAFEWEDFKKTVEWCKDNIYLSTDTSPYAGMMSFERTPWIEEILNDWDKPWIEEYGIMASTQVGKTTIEFCCIAKELDTDPTMMQLSIPNDKDVPDYIKKKLDPFMRGVKSLQTKLIERKDEEKQRLKNATKEVAGGTLFVTGNTPSARASNTIRCFFGDEVSLYESGDVSEFRERTKFFELIGRKIMLVSSRRYNGDEIELAYEAAYCKKELQIECKGCGAYFYPIGSKQFKFLTKEEYKKNKNIQEIDNLTLYKKEARETGRLVCECGYGTTFRDIEDLIREKKVKLVIVEGEDEDTRHGYKLNALATGLTKYSTLVEELIDAGDDDAKLDRIYRGYFNEPYEAEFIEKEQSDMLTIGNGLKEWIVPKDVLKIYVTVDNQMDHLYIQVSAVCYGVNLHILHFGRVESWNQAEEIWEICQHLQGEDGEQYCASAMGIDRRGYNEGQISRTDEADAFVHYMTQKYGEDRIYAMEGHPDLPGGKSFSIVNHKDYSNQRKELKVKIIKFSNLYIKNQLFRSIDRAILKAKAKAEDEEGFNYVAKLFYINQDHINRDAEYTQNDSLTKMLTAETFGYAKHPKTGKMAETQSWIPIRKRNDAIDTSTMALTLAEKDKLSLMAKPTDNIDIAKTLGSLSSL